MYKKSHFVMCIFLGISNHNLQILNEFIFLYFLRPIHIRRLRKFNSYGPKIWIMGPHLFFVVAILSNLGKGILLFFSPKSSNKVNLVKIWNSKMAPFRMTLFLSEESLELSSNSQITTIKPYIPQQRFTRLMKGKGCWSCAVPLTPDFKQNTW